MVVVLSCSLEGKIVKFSLHAKYSKSVTDSLTVKGPVDTIAVREGSATPDYTSFVAAVGGQERETEIYKFEWATTIKGIKQEEGAEEAKSIATSLWQARNVKNDRLHLRVPVWIRHIAFLPAAAENLYKLQVVTRSGLVRFYDSAEGRRPRQEVRASHEPVSAVTYSATSGDVVVSDTKSSTYLLGPQGNGTKAEAGAAVAGAALKMRGKLTGSTGAVKALALYGPNAELIVAGGLDRYLRVFENGAGRACVGKVFVGTHISAIAAISGFEDESEADEDASADVAAVGIKRERDDNDEEGDELWKELEEVSSTTATKSKKKKTRAE
ncbi:hypothetical protein D0Z00_002869 [Geotrichum galactomycetum]|uniref:Uncharacterized protein n=1 Tax=Geotrichum galactomycetum TaxID=27317 RepID=A0ACB6V2X4_9ASCO|nr:hypothetical protein D0Z00_002869 [Geotrichum candidum]